MQKKYLNWELWSLVTLLSSQWFGASVKVKDPKDEWLLLGLDSFLTEVFFKYHSACCEYLLVLKLLGKSVTTYEKNVP